MAQNLLLQNADAVAVTAAWVVTLVWLVARGVGWWWRAPVERWLLPLVFFTALAPRAALPWGPLNFADGERLEALWGVSQQLPQHFSTVPLLAAALHNMGLGMAAILRWAPPIAGASAVAATYLMAQSFGLKRASALLASSILCAWPAHLHYSTGLTFSVEGTPFWIGAFAVAAAGGVGTPWRPAILAALTVLGVYARPEFRLLVVPLAAVVLGPGWTWKERGRLAAYLILGFAAYLPSLVPHQGTLIRSGHSAGFVPLVLRGAALTPVWWVYAAVAGVALPTAPRWNLRLALAVAVALLGASYWTMASEANPRWGQWRYYVALAPLVAVAAAAFVEWVLALTPERYWRRWFALVPIAVALAPLPLCFPALRRPEDLAVEFDYLRASARRVLGERREVLLLANREHADLSNLAVEGNPTMALATVAGPLPWPLACEASHAPLALRDVERVLASCPERLGGDRARLYLGLFRDEARLANLRARFDLVPVEEITRTVAFTSTMINQQCPGDPTGFTLEGPWGRPCRVRLGWYRLVPR